METVYAPEFLCIHKKLHTPEKIWYWTTQSNADGEQRPTKCDVALRVFDVDMKLVPGNLRLSVELGGGCRRRGVCRRILSLWWVSSLVYVKSRE